MDSTDATLPLARRSFLTRLGAGVTALGAAAGFAPAAQAQSAAGGSPAPRHAQDGWFDQLPRGHRFVIDSTTANGFGAAVLYANNFFLANQNGYGLKDADLGVVIVARHFSTVFAYNEAMWAKHGPAMARLIEFTDPKTKQPPTTNLFNSAEYGLALPNLGTTLDTVLKRGVHLAVCQMATQFIAGQLAQTSGGNAEALYTELASNLAPNSHLVAAGVVAVNRAQEYGYSFLYAE